MNNKPKATLLILHPVKFDNRVLRHAESLKKIGFQENIVCIDPNTEKVYQSKYLGLRVKHLPSRMFYGIRKRLRLKFARILQIIRERSVIIKIRKKLPQSVRNFINLFFSGIQELIELLITMFSVIFFLLPRYITKPPITNELIREKSDLYIANDLPALIYCYQAAKANNAKLVYDIHDIFLEVKRRKINKEKHNKYRKIIKLTFLYRLLQTMDEKKIIKKSDLNMTVNNSIASYYSKKYKIQKPLVVRNAFEFTKVKRSRVLHERLHIPAHKKIVLYQGGLAKGRGIETLIKSLRFLKEKFVIVLLGYGHVDYYLSFAEKYNVKHMVYFYPAVNKQKLISLTASADVGCVLSEDIDLNKLYALPNKLFEYIMGGLPVVSSDLPELRKVIQEEDIGLLVNPQSSIEVAAAIQEVVLPSNWETYHVNSLRAAKEKYNWEKEVKGLLEIYRLMFKGRLLG